MIVVSGLLVSLRFWEKEMYLQPPAWWTVTKFLLAEASVGTGESSAPVGPQGTVAREVWGDWGQLALAGPGCPVVNSDLFWSCPFLQELASH